ncbi:MAG: hypothetical protein EA423_11185 [Phycisphaerales bacterium]|nr:MAG: hypothetical protein EA423_11185 [Phycisphaerales bacterium]
MRTEPKRILVLANADSGAGRGLRLAERARAKLTDAGHEVELLAPRAFTDDGAGGSPDLVVVSGGDGSIHYALPRLIELGSPLYHLPAGTENLVARSFSMTSDPRRLLGAIERGRDLKIDLGTANGRPFAIMLSAGPDAGVIHRLAAKREGTITKLSYAGPVLREAVSPRLVRASVSVDGREAVGPEKRAILLVANLRRYGAGLDPALLASPHDGKLDMVWLPAKNAPKALGWAIACRLRQHGRLPASVFDTGSSMRIEFAEMPAMLQADGEPLPTPDEGLLTIETLPGALTLRVPPEHND